MRLVPDLPIGSPGLGLSEDEILTAINLICTGCMEACSSVHVGMLEVPINVVVRKAMRRVKQRLGLTNIQIGGEYELLNMESEGPDLTGRIDITLQYAHQFGDEDNCLVIECKRVAPDDSTLISKYVDEGVDRFATGKYSLGHGLGFMLGYVLRVPIGMLAARIDEKIQSRYGESARLSVVPPHRYSLSMHRGNVPQGNTSRIVLIHIFVDMSVANKSIGKAIKLGVPN